MNYRLTKEMRAEIIHNALKKTSIGAKKNALLARAKTLAQSIIKRSLPPGWDELVQSWPKEWFQRTCVLDTPYRYKIDGNEQTGYPLDIPKILEGTFGRSVTLDDPVAVPANFQVNEHLYLELVPLVHEARELVRVETELRDSLSAAVNAFRTVDQLLKAMPELKDSVPSYAAPMPLVAPSNALAKLMAEGFPDG